MTTVIFRVFTVLFFALALIGIIVPGLPTVVFILLSAGCASKGWPSFEAWLISHPRFGPHIKNWRSQRAIPRKAKWTASVFMGISIAIILYVQGNDILRYSACLIIACVAFWIWTRNEPA